MLAPPRRRNHRVRLPDPEEKITAWPAGPGRCTVRPARHPIAAGAAARTLAEAHARALAALEAAETALADLVQQRERLQRGEHDPPPIPYTRLAGVRDGRSGAPLWRVVDFHEGVGEADRAGLEAALEAAGLLDAWVTPGGRLLDPGTTTWRHGGGGGERTGAPRCGRRRPDDPQAAQLADATVAACWRHRAGQVRREHWVEQTAVAHRRGPRAPGQAAARLSARAARPRAASAWRRYPAIAATRRSARPPQRTTRFGCAAHPRDRAGSRADEQHCAIPCRRHGRHRRARHGPSA